jgi:hypothetical protein
MRYTLLVAGPSPLRGDPTRCADRESPNAGPLVDAARRLIASAPGAFPIREPFGISVTFGNLVPEIDGYSPVDPIIEILVEAGVIADEGLEDWETVLQDEIEEDSYSVTIEDSDTVNVETREW